MRSPSCEAARASFPTTSAGRLFDVVAALCGVMRAVLDDLTGALAGTPLHIWTNCDVPPNDGGLSLGQAALTLFTRS